MTSLFFLLLCLPSLALSSPPPAPRRPPGVLAQLWPQGLRWRRGPSPSAHLPRAPSAYFPPPQAGGAMLTKAPGTDLGEPLNVILAGTSDPAVLIDTDQNGGFRNYWLSVNFAAECLGQHQGDPQQADLGDGRGFVNESGLLRYDYLNQEIGTCEETVQGGNHFRYFMQDGAGANTSAVFLATSYELPIAEQHNIVVNGYNLGRDRLVGNITGTPVDTLAVTNASTFAGTTSNGGYTYATTISYVSGLLANSSAGVNHGDTVGIGGETAVDGLVAVLEVKITAAPKGANA
ncbi:hypothetical protein B0H17DRAFT_928908 [Mycena rosella]|uniref:Uncharacterized protein n=1 Tax=Mycena rosella TaxID=1033263 RepID=A0AAD7DRN8_MYCRO|nr:hypothetical protein B0H17DRAFT_928908 [Mycena rosella]